MKKMPKGIPNQRLKAERELRGWSQKYVADQIGADHYYLSRWERGTASPSPYYRQKLCTLFGKNAKELGLLQEESSEDLEKQSEGPALSAQAQRAIHDPALPLLSVATTELIGRYEVLSHLKERLCTGKNVGLTALKGLPGVGKTTLAVALAHDGDVQAHFQDGILWAGLGPHPNVLGQLSRWGTLLGTPGIAAARLNSIEAWTRIIRAAIGTRRVLLAVDDAWQVEEALAFKVGGPNSAYLVTTRFPQVASQFAGEGAVMVRELSGDDGFTLLKRLAPETVASDPEAAYTLVRTSGGLPLALNLMGKYLRTQEHGAQPRRMRAAMERLRDAEQRLRLSEPQALLERSATLSANTPLSLQAVIDVSDQQMDEQARAALRALAVFPAKPNTFSEAAALAVCQAPVEALDTLTDAGLMESAGSGRYTLHQTISDYAGVKLADTSPFEWLASYFADYVVAHVKDYEALEQESSNIFAALDAASKHERHADLVRCITAFAWFLQARGLYAQAETYLTQAERAARLLQDSAGLAAVLLHLGKTRLRRGDYDQSEVSLLEGVIFARQNEDAEQVCQFLLWLGAIAGYRGDYNQAETYQQEGLALARQLGDPAQTSILLQGVGTFALEQGRYAQAEACFQEGLALARQAGDRERLCELLLNSGSVAYLRGDYTQGDSYSLEALQIARQSSNRPAMTILLSNLGEIATERGDYAQAGAYLREALEIARLLEQRTDISTSLVNLGRIAMGQGNHEQAEAYLQEALEIARQIGNHRLLCDVLYSWGELDLKQSRWAEAAARFGEVRDSATGVNQEYLAMAIYGLARVAAAQGESKEARELGQESLRIAESIGNRLAAQVRAWLDTLQL